MSTEITFSTSSSRKGSHVLSDMLAGRKSQIHQIRHGLGRRFFRGLHEVRNQYLLIPFLGLLTLILCAVVHLG